MDQRLPTAAAREFIDLVPPPPSMVEVGSAPATAGVRLDPSALDIALSELAYSRELLRQQMAHREPSGDRSTKAVSRHYPKLPQYDGETDYGIFRVQAAAILSACSDADAATALITCLRG